MTIDELTVRITVAAEEAEAALDTLMEKVRACLLYTSPSPRD